MSDMTLYLNALVITIAILTALLLLINLFILIMRPIARRNAAQTDLDQIGHEATVVKTIRPGKPGQIRYMTADGIRLANAESDSAIRNGNAVLILSVVQSRFRVRRLSEEERAALLVEKSSVDLQPALPDVGSILSEDTYEIPGQNDQHETVGRQLRSDTDSAVSKDGNAGR